MFGWVVWRDLILAWRRRADVLATLFFFIIVVSLFPLGIGPERETLRTIARELVETVRKNTTIDWTMRENVRAHLRVLVKRILRKYGYPPDMQEKAVNVDADYVRKMLADIVKDQDLSRYIL